MTTNKSTSALRAWLEDPTPDRALRSANILLTELVTHKPEDVFSDLNVILFRRIAELDWPYEPKAENPLFLVARTWLGRSPPGVARSKLVAPLRKASLEALEELKHDLTREKQAIACLNLLLTLLDEPDFPDFALTFLKVQRFSVDAVGRHLRRNEQDLTTSAQSCLASLRILFRHSSRALFDPNPALLLFFDSYPRWADSKPLAEEVLQFCADNALGLTRRTTVFHKYHAELMNGYLAHDAACRNLIEVLVEIWTKEQVVPSIHTLILETLSQDPREDEGLLSAIVVRSAPTAKTKLEAVRSSFQAEQEGAIPRLPEPLLDAICEAFAQDQDLVQIAEEEDLVSELAVGLLNSSNSSAGRICWILGEYGPRRGWRAGFDGLRTFAAIVNLSDYERCAAIDALVKFALMSNKKDGHVTIDGKQLMVDYKSITETIVKEMPLPSSGLAHQHRERALRLLEMRFGRGRAIVFGT